MMAKRRASGGRRKRRCIAVPERFESRHLLTSAIISEFVADNETGLTDEDGDFSDWIELYNHTSDPLDLQGWSLTDDSDELAKWSFPTTQLLPGEFLTVFASEKDRAVSNAELHTNFRLSSDGEYLALVRPDQSIAHEYTPEFPRQLEDVSYGVSFNGINLIEPGADVDFLIPTDGSLGNSWRAPGFNPVGWQDAVSAVGFGLRNPGFEATMVVINGSGADTQINTTTEAENALQGINFGIASEDTQVVSEVDFAGGGGNYGVNNPYPNGSSGTGLSDFVVRAEASVTIPVGDWTIGFGSDDGGKLQLDGVNFFGESNVQGDTPGDDEIRYEGTRGHNWTSGQISVVGSPITTTLDSLAFERGGGDSFEIAIRSGHGNGNYVRDGGTLLSDGALGWSVATPASDVIQTDIEGAMRHIGSSAYLLYPFNVQDPNEFETLTLSMKYNDGFVAYLNGTEIARRNAPVGAVDFDDVATASRSTADSLTTESISVTAAIPELVAGNNVLAIHGLNDSVSDGSFLIAPELNGGGLLAVDPRYFSTTTPGSVNVGDFFGVVGDTSFSVDRGFYDAPISVEITTSTADAEIRYTTDGSDPTETHGDVYTGPITIDATTSLRAMAHKQGYLSTNIDTHTYIFVDEVITQDYQATLDRGFPASWGSTAPDYGMDSDVIGPNDLFGGTYEATIRDDLKAVPTLSISLDNEELFGTNGIYTHSTRRGVAYERAASVELIHADGSEGFQQNVGLRMQGGAFRNHGLTKKHSFRLLFKGIYGPTKLDYPIFGEDAVTSFDTLTLRSHANDGWQWSGAGSQPQYIRDEFGRRAQLLTGQPASHGTFMHLYINGVYWGLYNTVERPDAAFASSYMGGDKDEWDAINSGKAIDGNFTAWNELVALADQVPLAADEASRTALFQQLQGNNPDGTRNLAYPVYLDMENMIDYFIVNFYGGNSDWPHHNYYHARQRGPDSTGYKFFMWDSEWSLDLRSNVNTDRTGVNNRIAQPYDRLRSSEEFRLWFGDRVHKHLLDPAGVFYVNPQSPNYDPAHSENNRPAALYASIADEVREALVAESARWGDQHRALPYTPDADWEPEFNDLLADYFPQRTANMVSIFRNAGLYPALDAPTFNQHGGTVNAGFNLLMSAPQGVVYYTTDGSDPRLQGGGISPTALMWDGSSVNTTLIAQGSDWKYLDDGSDQGTAWQGVGFNDASWAQGPAQLGYGDGDEATVVSYGPSATNKYITTYFRKTFDVTDAASIDSLDLDLLRDDGAIVYINGQEVVRSNMPAGNVTFTTTASGAVSNENSFANFSLDPSVLVDGTNTIAIEIHQTSGNSSDIGLDVILRASSIQVGTPVVLTQSTSIAARALDNGSWSAMNEARFLVHAPADASNYRITEVNYNPYDPTPAELAVNPAWSSGDFEFIEFQNISGDPINLEGVVFDEGVDFDFTNATSTELGAGEYAIVVRNIAAFEARYGTSLNVIGQYTGGLSDSGEDIEVLDRFGATIHDFEYNDTGNWPGRADGTGSSLVVNDVLGAYSAQSNWRPSVEYGGNPGTDGLLTYSDVVVNEVLSHTDLPQTDSIELYNTTNNPIDISGWYLSDTATNLRKFQIPPGTILAGGGYITFDESDFNPTMGASSNDFALDGAHGDDVWLMSVDGAGDLDLFADRVEFGAAANGEAFGRWPNAIGELYPMQSLTLSSENSGPRIGPVIISEVMYHPTLSGLTGDISDMEFLEILNTTPQTVDIGDWVLDDAVDYEFPPGTMMSPGEAIVVVRFDPNDVALAAHLADFLTSYNVPAGTQLFGGYSGRLGNGSDRVQLFRRDTPPLDEPNFYPLILEDEVDYNDDNGWPMTPDGQGDSLTRLGANLWGNDFVSWEGAIPTPGVGPDSTPPTLVSVTPANGSYAVDVAADLTVEFSEPILGNAGDVRIRRSVDQSVYAIYSVNDPEVSFAGNVLTINPAADLETGQAYYVEIDATGVVDIAGNLFAGISGSSAWSFATAGWTLNEAYIGGILDANGDTVTGGQQDQFVELVNSSGATVDIGGWTLRSTSGVHHTFPALTVLDDGGAVVVFSGGAPQGSFGDALVQTFTETLALPSGPDGVFLNDGSIDVARFDYSIVANGTASITRSPDLVGSSFLPHDVAPGAGGADFSPGTEANGASFSGSSTHGPSVNRLEPAVGSGNVGVHSNLQVHFNEYIELGSGQITIRRQSDDSVFETFDVATSPQVTRLDDYLVNVAPSTPFAHGTTYYVDYDAGITTNAAGNGTPAVSQVTVSWDFTTIAATNPTGMYINEVLFDPPGAGDAQREYVELRSSTAGLTIPNDTYFVAVAGAQGTISNVFDLSGTSFGSNRFLTLLPDGHPYAATVDPTGAVLLADGNNGWNGSWGSGASLPDEAVSFFLLNSTTPPTVGQMVDSDSNGNLDGSGNDWTVFDSVAVGSPSLPALGNLVFSEGGTIHTAEHEVSVGYSPDYVGRSSDTVTSQPADWVAGEVTGTAPIWALSNSMVTPVAFADETLEHIGSTNFPLDPPPAISSLSPLDNAVDVDPTTDLLVSFNEDVTRGSGSIRIRRADNGAIIESFNTAVSPQLSIQGNQLTIDPITDLPDGVNFYVEISGGAIRDLTGNSFGGFVGPGAWDFRTELQGADDLLINEVMFNAPGVDTGREYLEFRGAANLTIAPGTYLVAIEGDSGSNELGWVDHVFDLSGMTLGANGFLVLAQDGQPYDEVIDLAATVHVANNGAGWNSTWSSSGGDLENTSNSFLLVRTLAAPQVGDDVDANDDGVLDGAAVDWLAIDSVAALDGDVGDISYAETTFSRDGVGTANGAHNLSVNFRPEYLGRDGDSIGGDVTAWVTAQLVGTEPRFQLSTSEVAPVGRGGASLDHVGRSNFPTLLEIIPSDGSYEVAEGGVTDSFTLRLGLTPVAPVTVTLEAGGQVLLSDNSVAGFTDLLELELSDSQPVVLYVQAVDDQMVENDHSGQFNVTLASTDATFDGLDVPVQLVSITDNERAAPDLEITDIRFRSLTSEGFEFEYTIVNRGGAAANLDGPLASDLDNVKLQVNASTNEVFGDNDDLNLSEAIIGRSPLGLLQPGESFQSTLAVMAPLDILSRPFMTVMVDPGDVVDEGAAGDPGELNNTATTRFETLSVFQFDSPTGVYSVAPGGTLPLTLSVVNTMEDLSGFQLNFSASSPQLQLNGWQTSFDWDVTIDGQLNLQLGDATVAASQLVNSPLTPPVVLGTFDVVAPLTTGSYTLSLGAEAAIDATALATGENEELFIPDYGEIQIVVVNDTEPPVARLVTPVQDAATNRDPGYVDVEWSDVGAQISGVASTTIDVNDIQIPGITIDSVQGLGGGVYRYFFLDGDQLPQGLVEVQVVAGEVTDGVGNPIAPTTLAFTLDSQPPQLLSVDVNGIADLVDPPDLPLGPQPSSWATQRSDLRSITVWFDETTTAVGAENLTLTNLGTNPSESQPTVIPLQEDHVEFAGFGFTLRFDPDELGDGIYQLDVRSTSNNPVRDGAGNEIQDITITGDATNGLYRLFGDINGDQGVSVFDFRGIAYWFGSAVDPLRGAPGYVDFNRDMGISIFDLTPFRSTFLGRVDFEDTPLAVDDGSLGAPVATVNLAVQSSIILDVLANDFDADNDQLTIVEVSSLVNPFGQVTIRNDGLLRYEANATPGGPWIGGIEQFTYTVSDGTGRQSTASVFVDVIDSPVAPRPAGPARPDFAELLDVDWDPLAAVADRLVDELVAARAT